MKPASAPPSSTTSTASSQPPTSWFWRGIVVPFALSRLILLIVGGLAVRFGTMRSSEWRGSENPIIDMWAHWDSYRYWTIVADGYSYDPSTMSNVAFFPLYPMVLRLLTSGSRNSETVIIVAWLVSNLSSLAALALLYKLIRLDGSQDVARRAVALLVWFPTSFYFSVMYTEGLFLLLTVAALYAARRQRFAAAGLLGGLSAATRLTGALLILPLAYEWWRQPSRRWSAALALALVPCGLLAYMLYLQYAFGDPLLFLHAETAWGRATSIAGVRVRIHSIVDLFRTQPLTEILLRLSVDLVFTVVAGSLLAIGLWRQRPSYLLYGLYSFGVPLASLQIFSMPRYVVLVFPLFVIAAEWIRQPVVMRLTLIVCGVLQALFFARWALWYWVA